MMKNIVLIFSFSLLLFSCTKEEGIGGKNTITGVIMIEERHELSDILIAEYPAAEERLYIIYGDDTQFSDDVRANYNGSYRFEYLYGGSYTVFAYSECKLCDSGKEPLFLQIELEGKKDDFVADTIVITNYVD